MSALSPVLSSSSSQYHYRCTASHHKTLNVLGKVKNFAKLSLQELSGYCGLVQNENGCEDAADAADTLAFRFGWSTSTRLSDIELAWKSLNFSLADEEEEQEEDLTQKELVIEIDKDQEIQKSTDPLISASSVPVIIKNNAWERKVLLCEVDDQEFNILGDSGAVGRISVNSSSLMVDVKGRQYKGQICPGPTVMLLNLAPPVGQSTSSSSYQQTARVEVLTNEYCQLTFEKDLLGSMMGLYTGSMASYDSDNDEEQDNANEKKKKRNVDEDSDDSADDNEEDQKGKSATLKAPKISNVTNRQRISTKSKKGGKKKPSKNVKKSKK